MPVADEKGWYTNWVAVQRDITERKEAEAALQQLNQELEIRVQQRTQALERSQAALQQQMERERLMMAIAIQQSELYQQLQDELRERQQVETALRHSEAEFRSLSENSPVGIFQIDAQGRCTYTNPCCQTICGYTFEEALGEGWLQFVHPEDQEWLMNQWSQTLSEQQEFFAEVRYSVFK